MLRDSRARVVVVSDALPRQGRGRVAGLPRAAADGRGASSPLGGGAGGHPRLADLMAPAPGELAAAATTPDDVAFWLYSSGSTGAPKGAVHLHGHLMQTAALYGRGVLGIRDDDVVFSAAKLFFAYGLGNALTFPLAVGASGAHRRAARPRPRSPGSWPRPPPDDLLRRARPCSRRCSPTRASRCRRRCG